MTQVALTPDDMSDLFQTNYNVQQEYRRVGMRGLQVLYPTSVVLHTTGFAEGFETRVEVYDQVSGAHSAFDAAVAEDGGEVVGVAGTGEEWRATVTGITDRNEVVPQNASGVTIFAYKLIVRESNALVLITLKTPTSLKTERLDRIMKLVISRLGTQGS